MLALLVPSAFAAAPHPDAELLAACSEFARFERLWQAACWENDSETQEEDDRHNARLEAIRNEQSPFLELICRLPCSTRDGLMALLGSLAVFNGEGQQYQDDPDSYLDSRLETALLRAATSVS